MELGRAFAGALIFSVPMLMTMEMWRLGFYMDPLRLGLLAFLTVPLLLGLSHFGGLRSTLSWMDDLADAFVAVLVGALTAALVLAVFGVLVLEMPTREVVGKIMLQTVPASIGAMLARSQLGVQSESSEEERRDHGSYSGEIFLMAVGALFLSFNVAPTEEMILIAYKMAPWQEIALALLSIALMHGFVYVVNFRGGSQTGSGEFWSVFFRYTIVGYAVVLIVSLYILWTFGRTDGSSLQEIISASMVLAFPGAIGAAAARLVL